jgi:putative ubiquitin-RnfH superfamily antitoxin RatB of RatAB toxin-antitoxin module
MPEEIIVEVAYGMPGEQFIISIKVPTKFNVKQAIEKSGIQKKFSNIDLSKNKVGIFGKQTTLDHLLKDRDRIEIYRPLILDPKEMRRKRAAKQKKKTMFQCIVFELILFFKIFIDLFFRFCIISFCAMRKIICVYPIKL